eukprot:2526175-Amphidinium_carterae.1
METHCKCTREESGHGGASSLHTRTYAISGQYEDHSQVTTGGALRHDAGRCTSCNPQCSVGSGEHVC